MPSDAYGNAYGHLVLQCHNCAFCCQSVDDGAVSGALTAEGPHKRSVTVL
jgi:hypothetical protein